MRSTKTNGGPRKLKPQGHSRCRIIISILQGGLLLSTELRSIIPDSTCMTLIWAVLYNSKSSLLSGAVKEMHVNDRWVVIHHCRHLDTGEEITAQLGCVTSCVRLLCLRLKPFSCRVECQIRTQLLFSIGQTVMWAAVMHTWACMVYML